MRYYLEVGLIGFISSLLGQLLGFSLLEINGAVFIGALIGSLLDHLEEEK